MLLYTSLLFYLSVVSAADSATTTKEGTSQPTTPCTIRSPNSHAFYDLNPLHIQYPQQDSKTHKPRKIAAKDGLARANSWNATGYDVGYNFTMNFCGPVVEDVRDVEGVEKPLWGNVSAFYKLGGKTYSLGQQNSRPLFRGRKLVLNYTDGSPCDTTSKRDSLSPDLSPRELIDPDDDDDDTPKKGKKIPTKRRKSTIISILCDKDPLSPLLTLSFVGTGPDQCTYFFEARSSVGCAGIEASTQSLSPLGVFGVIVMIAVIVYMVGGCVYSRVVLNQRGWRQVPNYNLWAGIGGFFRDVFIILSASIGRLFGRRGSGYSRVQNDYSPRSRGRGGRDAEENRLIDELNEEWED